MASLGPTGTVDTEPLRPCRYTKLALTAPATTTDATFWQMRSGLTSISPSAALMTSSVVSSVVWSMIGNAGGITMG
jgi:hypothetical protein